MEYELIRSRRKSMAIEITRDCRLIVRAPVLCSRASIDRFVESRRDWIESHMESQRLRARAHPEPDEAERKRLIALAKEQLPPLVARYASLMGVSPTRITVTGARTRFGSCSGKNALSFSWRLMEYPPEAVELVVVHELCHIVHKNHGPEFYRLLGSVLPDHRERKKLLKK